MSFSSQTHWWWLLWLHIAQPHILPLKHFDLYRILTTCISFGWACSDCTECLIIIACGKANIHHFQDCPPDFIFKIVGASLYIRKYITTLETRQIFNYKHVTYCLLELCRLMSSHPWSDKVSNHTPPIRIPQLTWAIHECHLIVGMLCCYYFIHLALEISTVKPESADQLTGDQADSHTAKQQRGRFHVFMLGCWDIGII